MHLRAPRGGVRTVLFTGGRDDQPPSGPKVIQGILRDVTEQRELQRQLMQAQKMESIGHPGRRDRPRFQQHPDGDPGATPC